MMIVEVSGEPLSEPLHVLYLKSFAENRHRFRREIQRLRREFPHGKGWGQALRFYRVFWEKAGEYYIGLPTMYLPDALPVKKKYGKYLVCDTAFSSYEQATAVAEEIKKTMARPESLTMDFKMGEQSAPIPGAP